VELTVNFAMSGTASNGADFVQIPQTNSVTFAVDSNSIVIPIIPFLDHRTEATKPSRLPCRAKPDFTIFRGHGDDHDSPTASGTSPGSR